MHIRLNRLLSEEVSRCTFPCANVHVDAGPNHLTRPKPSELVSSSALEELSLLVDREEFSSDTPLWVSRRHCRIRRVVADKL